MEMHCSLWSRN